MNLIIKYEIDSRKLGVRLTNMKIHGIYKGKHTMKGETKIFNIAELKKHLKLDVLLVYNDFMY